LLYGVDARDPVTLASVIVVLAVVSLAACWLPARRAAHLNPVVVLRGD
jgi:ABC-type lipoprotein release transport system permease subunit